MGFIDSIPSLGLQVIRTKMSQVSHGSMRPHELLIRLIQRFNYHPLYSITTEVVMRKGWSSRLRNQSSGNITYHSLATMQ